MFKLVDCQTSAGIGDVRSIQFNRMIANSFVKMTVLPDHVAVLDIINIVAISIGYDGSAGLWTG